MRSTFASIAEDLVFGGVLKRMMNRAAGGDVTLGHYIGKSETQLRAGWQTVADFIEAAVATAASAEPKGRTRRDTMPRKDTSLDKLSRLPPIFDRIRGRGTLMAGNSSLLTDGAASLWVASAAALGKLPRDTPRARLVGLAYADIHLWEIHEAYSAQVLFHLKALESSEFLRARAGVDVSLGTFPRERMNPNGGSIALGHPFGATGAADPQSGRERAVEPSGGRARHRQHLHGWRPGDGRSPRSGMTGGMPRPAIELWRQLRLTATSGFRLADWTRGRLASTSVSGCTSNMEAKQRRV